MTTTLTDEQRQALQAEPGAPVAVLDEQTRQVYYLIPADQFMRVQALLVEDDFDPRELYPLTARTAAEAGWADPSMDVYDHYDEHRK